MDTTVPIDKKTSRNGRETPIDFFLIIVILTILSLTAVLVFLLLFQPRSTIISQDTTLLQPTDDPIQSSVSGAAADPITGEGEGMRWTLQPRANFQIAARVLGNTRYLDWQSSISPRDLALGWGELSDPVVDELIRWRHYNRETRFEWDDGRPYDRQYIRNHATNIHIIPATENLDKALRNIHKNDLIYLEGYLVDIEARRNGQIWRVSTSLTRRDLDCEILYVERLVLGGRLYE